MFMEIAIGAIGIGIVIMIGYIVLSQVNAALPNVATSNPCYNVNASGSCLGADNTSQYLANNATDGLTGVLSTTFAGLGLIAVGIIVLAAFGLINIFK